MQKLLSSIRPHLLISVFISFALGDRILEEHIEALTGFSHVYRPDGLNITLLSEGCIPAMTPAMKMVARTYIPRRREWGVSNCLGAAHRSTNRQPRPPDGGPKHARAWEAQLLLSEVVLCLVWLARLWLTPRAFFTGVSSSVRTKIFLIWGLILPVENDRRDSPTSFCSEQWLGKIYNH